jgi:hypothetical protein
MILGIKKLSQQTLNWLKLLLWVVGILLFTYGLAPWMQDKSQAIQTLSTYIDESGIDAGAIYYTEVEEVGEADLMIRDTFRFYLKEKE